MPDFESKTPDLNTRKEFLNALSGGLTQAFIISDDRGNIISFNGAAVDLLRYDADEFGDCTIGDIFPSGLPDEFSILDAALGRPLKNATPQLCDIKTKEGKTLIVQAMITRFTNSGRSGEETVIILKDPAETAPVPTPEDKDDVAACKKLEEELRQMTERLEASEAQLLHTQKMAALGQLVSGVSHELSNTLMGIYGCAKMTMREVNTVKGETNLQNLIEETLRGMGTVRNLLLFARTSDSQKKPVSINEAINRILDLKSYDLANSNVKVSTDFDEDSAEVMADFNQLQQVFLNLVNNAQQAIRETGQKGNLYISTSRCNGTVQAVVSNDGPRIPPDIIGNIFAPFFTTKEAGWGTGLGLSICCSIIEDHGGKLSVKNNEGVGVTFTVDLPAATGEGPKKGE